MKYNKAVVKNGQIEIVETKTIDQSNLTSDCWLIQFNGLEACKNCKVKNTPDCGGGKILKTLIKL